MGRLMLSLSIIAACILICSVMAVFRQQSVDHATMLWQRAGGGIIDSEVYLIGPGAVFLDIPENITKEDVDAINDAAKDLFRTCSPSLSVRWRKSQLEMVPGGDQDLLLLNQMLEDVPLRKLSLSLLDASNNSIIALIKSIPTLESVSLPNRDYPNEKIDELNQLLGRKIVKTFVMFIESSKSEDGQSKRD